MVEQTTTGQVSEIKQAPARSPGALPSVSLQILSPAALLALWELSARLGLIETKFFPAPSAIAATFWQLAWTSQFWQDIGISLGRMVIGFFWVPYRACCSALRWGCSCRCATSSSR
jgi:NitT/TauT family transport system permease protein